MSLLQHTGSLAKLRQSFNLWGQQPLCALVLPCSIAGSSLLVPIQLFLPSSSCIQQLQAWYSSRYKPEAGKLVPVPDPEAGTLLPVPDPKAGALLPVPDPEEGTLLFATGLTSGALLPVPECVPEPDALLPGPLCEAGALLAVPVSEAVLLLPTP